MDELGQLIHGSHKGCLHYCAQEDILVSKAHCNLRTYVCRIFMDLIDIIVLKSSLVGDVLIAVVTPSSQYDMVLSLRSLS